MATAISVVILRPFTEEDWNCWSGCQAITPLVAFLDEEYLIIVDDERLDFYFTDEQRWVEEDEYEGSHSTTTLHSPIEAETVAQALVDVYNEMGQDHFVRLATAICGPLKEIEI